MAEENDMGEIINTEGGDDFHRRDQNDQPFVLLSRVTQSNGKPLPIGGFTGRAMAQMLHEVAGVVPKEVVIIGDQEVVVELEEENLWWKYQEQYMGCSIGWVVHSGG